MMERAITLLITSEKKDLEGERGRVAKNNRKLIHPESTGIDLKKHFLQEEMEKGRPRQVKEKGDPASTRRCIQDRHRVGISCSTNIKKRGIRESGKKEKVV